MTNRPTERLLPGEGEEVVRRVLEDGVIARERDPHKRAGWTISDLADDLGVSDERARKIVRREGKVSLRAGQVLALRPRIRAAVLAALTGADQRLGGSSRRRTIDSHLRRCTAQLGRISELLDRAEADGHVDDRECAALREALLRLASDATNGADDLSPIEADT